MLNKRYRYISSIARHDFIFLRNQRKPLILQDNELDYNIKKKRLTRLYYKYKFYNKEIMYKYRRIGFYGLPFFLYLHGCGPRQKVTYLPLDLDNEFEDTGSLKDVSGVLTNLMIKEVNEEIEKVSNNKDNAMNKICNVYSDLLKDKENVNYNDIKTVSDTINKVIENGNK